MSFLYALVIGMRSSGTLGTPRQAWANGLSEYLSLTPTDLDSANLTAASPADAEARDGDWQALLDTYAGVANDSAPLQTRPTGHNASACAPDAYAVGSKPSWVHDESKNMCVQLSSKKYALAQRLGRVAHLQVN